MVIIVRILFLLLCLTYGFACNVSCIAECAILNPEAACFEGCGCKGVPHTPRSPNLTLQFVLQTQRTLETYAALCNKSCLEECQNVDSTQQYSVCLKRCECSDLFNGDIWMTQLSKELRGVDRPKYFVSVDSHKECEKKCEDLCSEENSIEKSACVPECYQILCAEKPSLSNENFYGNLPTSMQFLYQILQKNMPNSLELHSKHEDEEENDKEREKKSKSKSEDQEESTEFSKLSVVNIKTFLNLKSEGDLYINDSSQDLNIKETGWILLLIQLLYCISILGAIIGLYIKIRMKKTSCARKLRSGENSIETPYIFMN